MNPKGGGFPKVAGTSTPAGASPSRPVLHQQGRVGCKVECNQPKGEQKGAYSLHPHYALSFSYIQSESTIAFRTEDSEMVPPSSKSSHGPLRVILDLNSLYTTIIVGRSIELVSSANAIRAIIKRKKF